MGAGGVRSLILLHIEGSLSYRELPKTHSCSIITWTCRALTPAVGAILPSFSGQWRFGGQR